MVLEGDHYVDLAYHPGMDRVAAVVAGGQVAA
jgi:imidazolonepropionase-like amidohydrolase